MKKYILAILSVLALIAFISVANADDPKRDNGQSKEDKVRSLLTSQHYVFKAQNAMPMGMAMRQLGYGYDLKVTKDTITAFLPYFGESYVAPMGSNADDISINFTSTDFDYKLKQEKKGWKVNIEIKDDVAHGYQLSLYVTKSGTATLRVNDNGRSSISFEGYIDAK